VRDGGQPGRADRLRRDQSDQLLRYWTQPEIQPEAATQASPALAGAGYDLYLGWTSPATKYLFTSYAENPY
jgi:hypothetical protein